MWELRMICNDVDVVGIGGLIVVIADLWDLNYIFKNSSIDSMS